MRFTTRPATEADSEVLFELHRETMKEYVAATYGWDELDQRARFARQFDADPSGVSVILVDGRVAGALRVEDRDDSLYIADIEVALTEQNRGFGTAVIRSIVGRAGSEGRAVELQVLRVNPSARRLYERLGFRVTRETETHIEMRYDPPSAPTQA